MIWINSRGGVQPFGSQTATTNVAGMNWNVWTGQQTSWKIISYVLNPGATSVSNLDLKALFQDAVARGSINPSNYLIDVEAGFEIWQGGQGLGTNSFSVTATAAGTGGGDTTPPSVPSNLAVTGVTTRPRPRCPGRRPPTTSAWPDTGCTATAPRSARPPGPRSPTPACRPRRSTRTRSPPTTRPATSRPSPPA